MMWHVVFAERGGLPQSRAARSRDSAIRIACEFLSQSCDVRRVIEPNGSFIERGELDEHFDSGRFRPPSRCFHHRRGGNNGAGVMRSPKRAILLHQPVGLSDAGQILGLP